MNCSLSFILDCSAKVVSLVRSGKTLKSSIKIVLISLNDYDIKLFKNVIKDISYNTIRFFGLYKWLIDYLLKKKIILYISSLLMCALHLCIKDKRYKYYTIVNQSVSLMNKCEKNIIYKKIVNAVLRNFLRNKNILLTKSKCNCVAYWNYPLWWINIIKYDWSKKWRKVLSYDMYKQVLVLRINTRLISVSDYLNLLKKYNFVAVQIGSYAVKLKNLVNINNIPGFSNGLFSVQDLGAQFAVEILNVDDGMYVLDACSAPGGKTCHLLELANINLISLDININRALYIKKNLDRLKLKCEIRIGDATDNSTWFNKKRDKLFDRIFVDVPCSSSGVVRRYPDIKWLRRISDIYKYIIKQRRILISLWSLLKVDGELVYSACSIFKDECEKQAKWFIKIYKGSVQLNLCNQFLPKVCNKYLNSSYIDYFNVCLNKKYMKIFMDYGGFFYAKFKKI